MSILTMISKRKRMNRPFYGLGALGMLVLMLLAAYLPGLAQAASVMDVVKEVARANSQIEEGVDMFSFEEPIAGGSMKVIDVGGELDTGEQWAYAWFGVHEPVGNTSMARLIEHMSAGLDEDANMKVIAMDGYEIREITYDDYVEGVPNDDVTIWIVLARHVIEIDIEETGYDKAANLQMARNMGLQLKSGLEKAGLTSPTGPSAAPTGANPDAQPGTSAAAVTARPLAEPVKVSDTMNIAGVGSGPTAPTTFSLNRPHLITKITNYHWNSARGSAPGTIGFKDSNGKVYGPWPATTRQGQGGVPNAYWDVTPNIVVPAGTYTIIDSDSATWSQNAQSGGRGMGEVLATPQFEVTGSPSGDAVPGILRGTTGSNAASSASPAGVGSVGSIPGPANTTEAVAGVVVPGLIATALGALGGLGGGGLVPPAGGTPMYPGSGGPLPGTGGVPGPGGGTPGMPRATSQIGRRGKDEIFIDTTDMFEEPAAGKTAGHGAIVDSADEAGIFVQPEPEIYIDTVEMTEGSPVPQTTADKGIFIETGEEAGRFTQPETGIIIETAQEAGVIRPESGILVDGSGDEILFSFNALEEQGSVDIEPETAGGAAGASAPGTDEAFDQDGFDKDGFDAQGFDKEGFDKDGFDAKGFDKEGFDKDGFDAQGFDKEGFDKDGFDAKGFDKEGFDKDGFDAKGFDKEGFDKDGFDAQGFDKEGFDKDGFDAKGFDKEGFDKDGFDAKGFDKEGFDKDGFDAKGFDKEGFDKDGFDAQGFDKEGFDKDGFDAKGFDKEGFDKDGFDAKGFDKEGFDKDGFDAKGFDKEGFDKDGFDAKGFDKEGFDKDGFDAKGFDKEGFDRDGFDAKGFDKEGFNKDGFDREGYSRNGYDPEGFDREGYDVNGYDRKGFNRSGFDARGYDKQGYDKAGFNKDGWDREGYNRNGFDKNGWDREGYDKNGYDAEGYDRDGYNRDGQSKEGYDADGYDKNGFNENGVDKDGYDREGFNYEGYNRDGYDPWGYNKQGYGKDGYHWSGYNADGYNRNGRHWSENPYTGDSPFNVSVEGDGMVNRNPFDGGQVIVEQDNYGNKIDLAGSWKPTKPPLGEPYPKTVDKYGAKPWTEEIPQPQPEKPAVPSTKDTGVIGPEDPMNTSKNHDVGKTTEVVPEGQTGTGVPIPEEEVPQHEWPSEPEERFPEDTIPETRPDTFDYTDPETGLTSTYEYEPGYTGPRHGDRQVLVGSGDGQAYEIEFNAVKGKWVNTENGNEFDPARFESWQRDVAEDKRRAAIELEKMAARQDANSKAIDKNLDDWRKLEQMQKAVDGHNIGEPGGPGDIDKAIQKLKDDMLAGKEVDQARMDQLRKIIGNRITGRTSGDTGDRYEEDWFKNLGWALEANAAMAKEVATGEKADGSISWLGMGAKIMITTATGGVVGKLIDGGLTVAEALSRIKDSIDKGESDFRAVSKALGLVVLGEQTSWLAGKSLSALNKEMLERFPVFTNKAADFIETALLKGSALNQQLSRKLGFISQESADAALDAINKRLVDIGGDQASGKFMQQTAVKQGTAAGGKAAAQGSQSAVRTAKVAKPSGKPTLKTVSTETPGLKIDKNSFKEAGVPPDLRGMPVRDQKAIRSVCDKYGVKAHMRPTNPQSRAWLESGRAHPKPEMLKTKTINDLDVELGYPKENIGTVGCRKPDPLPSAKPADMTDAHWGDLQKRHKQRMTEYTDQVEKLKHLEHEGKIVWDQKTGIIYNKKTMKPYCGDHDTFAIVDAVSGKPVSPRMNEQINREFQSLGATQHNEHVGWDYSGLPDQVPAGSPTGAQSPREIAEGIDRKILGGHDEGGEALNTYDPLRGEDGGWTTHWWKGGVRE